MTALAPRCAQVSRRTRETTIEARLCLDGTGRTQIDTGIGFLDHLLDALCRHARFDLDLEATGDLHVDDHHTAEDCALVLGQALDQALGERRGVARFGWALAPLDEALAQAVVDLSGRPFPVIDLGLRTQRLGALSTQMVPHVLVSLAMAGRLTLHVDVTRGDNDHHRAEAAFKALALALKQAVARTGDDAVPSTKGAL